MTPRLRQLLCLWLVTVLTLLPVSGPLLAATATPGGDEDAPAFGHAHHGHAQDTSHPHHGHTPTQDASGDPPAGTTAFTPHDCHNAACGGGCTGCTGCHAPPSRTPFHIQASGMLILSLPAISSSPPPGAVFRPPIHTTA